MVRVCFPVELWAKKGIRKGQADGDNDGRKLPNLGTFPNVSILGGRVRLGLELWAKACRLLLQISFVRWFI